MGDGVLSFTVLYWSRGIYSKPVSWLCNIKWIEDRQWNTRIFVAMFFFQCKISPFALLMLWNWPKHCEPTFDLLCNFVSNNYRQFCGLGFFFGFVLFFLVLCTKNTQEKARLNLEGLWEGGTTSPTPTTLSSLKC